MGLHVTPLGTFYVQHSLRTGEVLQVFPVRRQETPSALPSVDSLGITDNFIERRRASIAADQARASTSQDRLQRELATAGGERLLETGKAVLAHRDDKDKSRDSSVRRSCSARRDSDDVEMTSAPEQSATPSESRHSQQRPEYYSSGSSSVHFTLNEDPRHPEMVLPPRPPPSSMAAAPQAHPVRPWPDSLRNQNGPVNLPPFREIDSARALSEEDELRSQERFPRGGRRRSITSPRLRRLRSTSRSSSRSNSATSMAGSSCTTVSTSSIATVQDGSNSFGNAYNSASDLGSTPSLFSPAPNYCSSTAAGAVASVAEVPDGSAYTASRVTAQEPASLARQTTQTTTSRTPGRASKARAPPSPRSSSPPSSLAQTSSSAAKKTKTVWIIRTLEPRKAGTKRKAEGAGSNGDDEDDYEPQQVKTHVETHIVS